jgi:hypothetical protein
MANNWRVARTRSRPFGKHSSRQSQGLPLLGKSPCEGAEPVAAHRCTGGFRGREITQAESVSEIGEVHVVTELVPDRPQVLVHRAFGAAKAVEDHLVPRQAVAGQGQNGRLGLG